MAQKKNSNKPLSGRFAIFATVLLFVCTLIFFNNQFSSGSIKRFAYWIFNGVRGDAKEVSITFDAKEFNRFSLISKNLLIVSPDEIATYRLSGKDSFTSSVILRNPSVSTVGNKFIAYDLGGLNFYIGNNKKILFSGTTESKLVNANLNKTGYFSIVTDSTDSKSLLTVYNPSFDQIYRYHAADNYVFDAAVSPSGKNVAVVSYGAGNGSFESKLSLCKTNEDGFYTTVSLGDSMPLEVSYHSEKKIFLICNDRTILFANDGSVISELSHNSLPVKAFSQSHGNHVAIALDNYTNGGNTRIHFIKNNGEVSDKLDFDEDIYSLSSAGDYTAIQFSGKCSVYKNDLTLHSEFPISADVSKVLVNSDGSVICVADNFATLYVQ